MTNYMEKTTSYPSDSEDIEFDKMFKSKLTKDKDILYSSRVLIGNWYEASKLEEANFNMFLDPMVKGELLLTKYRKMCKNLNMPTDLTHSTGTIAFGDKISLLAPHVPASHPSREDAKGLLLGAQLQSDALIFTQNLHDGCPMVTFPDLQPREKDTFVITSKDYCNGAGETLEYNQEFRLVLSSSVDVKPLYVRFDRNPIPGLCGKFPLYLSEHAVSNTRWRILPVQVPHITRFEQEGKPVPVNTNIIINHCATNINLGVDCGKWITGFFGKICSPLMKTCLDVHGCELPNNIWHIYSPT